MSHARHDDEIIRNTRNTARFFTESRHIAWVLLLGTMAWGAYGYWMMPQRKDPEIPIRQALVLVEWPGTSAEKIEQLVTRPVEEKIAENARVEKIESNTRTGITAVYITLVEGLTDVGKEFDDIKLKLDGMAPLPEGAGPVIFMKDFGDTAGLMLTVASPKVDEAEIAVRARSLQQAIETARRDGAASGAPRVTIAHGLPTSISPTMAYRALDLYMAAAVKDGVLQAPRILQGAGFIGVDAGSVRSDAEILDYTQRFIRERLRVSEIHPDAWPAVVIRDPADARARLAAVAGDKYSYAELEEYTDLISRTLKGLPIVSKVMRSGLLDEMIVLEYSQERLASYGVSVGSLRDVLRSRNITESGGLMEIGAKNVAIEPSGEFARESELAEVLVPGTAGGAVYLRDLANVARTYENPPSFLNYFGAPTPDGGWRRSRSITVAVQMRSGYQIAEFGRLVDATLDELRPLLPGDLVFARTSDQPRQVTEIVDLFMSSLYEAIFLVVLVSLIGFWEWRSALLMALSIPITLAMTFGMMFALGVDLQQISIGSLIIALGLLVDDPVVAGDAIKRDLAAGQPRLVAAWLGPTKLATAILFATITNIVAYLPFIFLPGDPGQFLWSLPVVIGCSLVASRIVSMTFIPLLGYYLLRPQAEKPIEERRTSGFAAWYYRFGRFSLQHRWAFLGAAAVVLAGGFALGSQLRVAYFPKDLMYLSYVDIWLPEDAPFAATAETTEQVEAIVRRVATEHDPSRQVLRSLTTFVGGGGPRFWNALAPEPQQLNYAQVLIEVYDKHDTRELIAPLQRALDAEVPGARMDVRQLETGAAVGIPVAIRISGEDPRTLRALAREVETILHEAPTATRVRNNWGPESFALQLKTNTDRANGAGITNLDVAAASLAALNGSRLTVLREGDKQIPVVGRMKMEERATLSDLRSLYVYSLQGSQKVPIETVASIDIGMHGEKIQRRDQFPTITVSAFPIETALPSEVLGAVMPRLRQFEASLPPGYHMEIGGEYEDQQKGFGDLAAVMTMSILMIFLALVIQFKHAVKPFIVFAAIPFGTVGALAALWIMGAPFGFMAFLGVASLVGVIVSHIIVLFDFIEEAREHGKPLEEALLDAGILRLRPVLITVAATVIALFPLAAHGGPLWEPMCYAQIGGLTVATFVTLLVVPVIYGTFVWDLKLVKWQAN